MEDPKDAVRVTFDRGFPSWTVNVANSANIAGKCRYTPQGPGGNLAVKNFAIGANGTASFTVPAPGLFQYHIVTSCHGTFNGKDIEFGHDEQDVP